MDVSSPYHRFCPIMSLMAHHSRPLAILFSSERAVLRPPVTLPLFSSVAFWLRSSFANALQILFHFSVFHSAVSRFAAFKSVLQRRSLRLTVVLRSCRGKTATTPCNSCATKYRSMVTHIYRYLFYQQSNPYRLCSR